MTGGIVMPENTIILVAEPDVAQQRVLTEALRSRYKVICATSIADAAQKIVNHRPVVLLLEVNQPDGDGVQFVRQLRLDPRTKDMVVACVTSRSSVRDKVAGFQAGADDYIIKPVNSETFAYRLLLLLRLRNLM
jgi:DNA-binding response OmpR family regulator